MGSAWQQITYRTDAAHAAIATFRAVDRRYHDIKREFYRTLKTHPDIDPMLIRSVEGNLRVIERAISDIERAIRKKPEHYALYSLLADTASRRNQLLMSFQDRVY